MRQHPAAKRFITSLALGGVFAGVCIGLAASGQPELATRLGGEGAALLSP